jgi:ribosomal protein S12 methylthiotransferase accessory factor
MFNTERDKKREDTAKTLNTLSRTELLNHFGISRVAELTRLDTIGVPVFTAVRALSKTIAVHAGKGVEARMCRAGAIAEAIEFEVAENPHGEAIVGQACAIPLKDRLEIGDCFPARASIVNDLTYLAWEKATNIQNGAIKLIPSDLIWMAPRITEQPFLYLQTGSNGLASGATIEDAILSGLYEVIERDAWTLQQFMSDNCGVLPKRIPLFGLPDELEDLVGKIDRAQLKLHLLDATNDYQIPVINAHLLDLSGNGAGLFSGFGAHVNARVAAIRAITEAIQARACYIAGARDDLFRRQFLLMKRLDHNRLHQMFSELEGTSPLNTYRTVTFSLIKDELRYVLRLIKSRGISEVYVKELGTRFGVHVVRVISPQCEPFRFEFWKPGLRCLSYAQRKMAELAKKQKVTEPDDEGEEWKEDKWRPC